MNFLVRGKMDPYNGIRDEKISDGNWKCVTEPSEIKSSEEKETIMIRAGIIGCGKIAQERHIPEYLANPDTEIAGYYDVNVERAAQLAERFGGRVYESIEEMLKDSDLDAVSVCTANIAHASNTIAALRAGKHVLCEKPMATTLEDCLAMADAAKTSGKLLMIDQNQRLLRTHQKAKELIAAGEIGNVLTFHTTFAHGGPETWSIDPGTATWFFDRKQSAMGAMADLGVHKTDLIQYLLGTRVCETMAKLTTLDKRDAAGNLIGVDDNAICIYTMENGVIGTMTASWTNYGPENNSTVIYGSQGVLHIFDDPEAPLKLVRKNGEEELYRMDQIQSNDNQTSSGIIDAFADCLVHGADPVIDMDTVLHAMKAVFASVASSETGTAVKVQ